MKADLKRAKELLERGELVAIPTETVYGLAANALNPKAIDKIYALKQRPKNNPLIVHLASIAQLESIADEIPEAAWKLAKAFWPGSLSLILKKKDSIPDEATAGNASVAVRVPNHPLTLDLLRQLDFPLVAPSANPYQAISPTTAAHVKKAFGKKLKLVLDGGECQGGLESTIIGFEEEEPLLYRLGSISKEQIEAVVGKVTLRNKSQASGIAIAPGLHQKHYAPHTPTVFCESAEAYLKDVQDKKVGILVFSKLPTALYAQKVEVLSPSGSLEEAAKNLYAALHRLDEANLELIITEKFPDRGLGKTINDKLKRASSES
jgi:L-threonylcarbamoyladenylate synthase